MAQVKVTHVDQSKSGKARVYFNGKHDWRDAYYIGQKCYQVPSVGQVIEADTSSKRFDGAKGDTWFLNSWKPVAGKQSAPVSEPAKLIPTHEGWQIEAGDLSRFVSNVVGQAISAGIVKTPMDIQGWVREAYRAGESLRMGRFQGSDVTNGAYAPEPDPQEAQGFEDDDLDSVPF